MLVFNFIIIERAVKLPCIASCHCANPVRDKIHFTINVYLNPENWPAVVFDCCSYLQAISINIRYWSLGIIKMWIFGHFWMGYVINIIIIYIRNKRDGVNQRYNRSKCTYVSLIRTFQMYYTDKII